MPRLTERDHIRSLLHTDHLWAAYALGDLAPGFYEHTAWYHLPEDPSALALTLNLFELPVLFLMGLPVSARLLLDEIGTLRRVFFLVRPEILPVFLERYRIEKRETMWRMRLEAADFHYTPPTDVERLGPADLGALQALFADGEVVGEAPDFFAPAMLEKGVYFGVREGEALIAAAGTHLLEPSEGVGAIGNVYTRRDRRGRGLATQVTGAVAAELVRRQLPTIVLNVNRENLAARRVYERLGFQPYCLYEEGVAIGGSATA
ncbi:MAG TPA: GNAT family N-acetyltransferase [Chthonomonadaceae bacterium]|nr:GNAT family N-acetyltransferase [Chthonomonadaceae bacterium]